MPATVAERQVRISCVAGRYLVFDIDDVLYIRRHHGICAVLTGTMPQNPTQNLFLGLPVELHAEEAKLLVDRKAAYIADELSDHLSQLTTMDETTRGAYLQHVKQQRRNAKLAFDEEKAKVQAMHQGKRRAASKAKKTAASLEEASAAAEGESPSLFDSPSTTGVVAGAATTTTPSKEALPAITPTTSSALLPEATPVLEGPIPASSYSLYKYLNSRGYYTTPGLRFGGDYSVYPGDPFRYHAHYLANSYGWDEPIGMLDVVTSGRLGTAVKKSFLFGAESPSKPDPDGGEGGEMRVFCVEWAGM